MKENSKKTFKVLLVFAAAAVSVLSDHERVHYLLLTQNIRTARDITKSLIYAGKLCSFKLNDPLLKVTFQFLLIENLSAIIKGLIAAWKHESTHN